MIDAGDKYIIELEAAYGFVHGEGLENIPTLYRAKGFRSLVFDKQGLEKLVPLEQCRPEWWQEAYKLGLDAAWEAATRLAWKSSINDLVEMGFLSNKHVTEYPSYVLGHFTASEALAKLRDYEARKKAEDEAVKVGDEVECVPNSEIKIIVTWISSSGTLSGIRAIDGYTYSGCLPERWRKTGNHFPEIAAVLEQMKGE